MHVSGTCVYSCITVVVVVRPPEARLYRGVTPRVTIAQTQSRPSGAERGSWPGMEVIEWALVYGVARWRRGIFKMAHKTNTTRSNRSGINCCCRRPLPTQQGAKDDVLARNLITITRASNRHCSVANRGIRKQQLG